MRARVWGRAFLSIQFHSIHSNSVFGFVDKGMLTLYICIWVHYACIATHISINITTIKRDGGGNDDDNSGSEWIEKRTHTREKNLIIHLFCIHNIFLFLFCYFLFCFVFCFLLLFILSTEVSSLWSFMLHAHSTIIAHTHSHTQREGESERYSKAKARQSEAKNSREKKYMQLSSNECAHACLLTQMLDSIHLKFNLRIDDDGGRATQWASAIYSKSWNRYQIFTQSFWVLACRHCSSTSFAFPSLCEYTVTMLQLLIISLEMTKTATMTTNTTNNL